MVEKDVNLLGVTVKDFQKFLEQDRGIETDYLTGGEGDDTFHALVNANALYSRLVYYIDYDDVVLEDAKGLNMSVKTHVFLFVRNFELENGMLTYEFLKTGMHYQVKPPTYFQLERIFEQYGKPLVSTK